MVAFRLRLTDPGPGSIPHLYSGDSGPERFRHPDPFSALIARGYDRTLIYSSTGRFGYIYGHFHTAAHANPAPAHTSSTSREHKRAATIHIFTHKLHHVRGPGFRCTHHCGG